jgi:hypothetical protein
MNPNETHELARAITKFALSIIAAVLALYFTFKPRKKPNAIGPSGQLRNEQSTEEPRATTIIGAFRFHIDQAGEELLQSVKRRAKWLFLAGIFLVGFLTGRQFPPHDYVPFPGQSQILLDKSTGRVCSPFIDPQYEDATIPSCLGTLGPQPKLPSITPSSQALPPASTDPGLHTESEEQKADWVDEILRKKSTEAPNPQK